MKLLILLIALSVAAACSTTDVAVPPPTTEDLGVVDTLREIDEQGVALLSPAKFQTGRKELSDFADEAIHAHEKRADQIKVWRTSSFSTGPPQVSLPPCAAGGFHRAPAIASDIQMLDGLIAHRDCAIRFAREAGPRVRSPAAASIVGEVLRTYERELQQFRKWRAQWQSP